MLAARLPSPHPPQPPLTLNSSKPPNFLYTKSPFFTTNKKLFKTRCKLSSNGFCVRAANTRTTPMETPGAYEVVDEETGQRVIVWGGSDDPPPVLDDFSKLNLDSSRRNVEDGSVANNDPPKSSNGKLAGGFGRLKAQKVKALVNRPSMLKQETDDESEETGEENVPSDILSNSNSKAEYIGKKEKETNVYMVEGIEDPKAGLDHDEFYSDGEFNPNEYHKPKTRRTRSEVSEGSISNRRAGSEAPGDFSSNRQAGLELPEGSTPNLRGWSNGASIAKSKSASADLSKLRKKYSADNDFFSRRAFRDMGCREYLIKALGAQLYIRPSHIQAMSFSSVFDGKSCIIADQSGSGKTLAYLAPLVQRLREEEIQGVSRSSSRSPRAVVLVPTAELASQVLSNCRSMSKHGVPFRSMVVTGGFRQKTQLENLQEGVDILIATPGRFMYLIKEDFLQLSSLRCAVLDEVDILFDDQDFEVALESLINSSPVTTQYLFVTATLPVDIYNKLVQVFPDCKVIMGPAMHRTSPGLEEVLVDCSGEDGTEKSPETAFQNKKNALLQLVEESPVPKTIVFCNKIETCRKVENVLKRTDRKGTHVRVLPFHAALAQDARQANMKEFVTSRPDKGSLFLVCTDRASRGIDFYGVDHVVLFDFPRDPSEYVRRVGRTARGAGGRGKAFIFVVGKQVSLARKIIERNHKGHPLHEVPAAYEHF